MELRLLLPSLLAIPMAAAAQGLTNAQVYDFAIGDIFQTQDQWSVGGGYASPLYVRDSVMDVQQDVGGYEHLYTIRTQRFRGPVGPFDAEDTTYIYQFGYVDGAALPEHYIDPSDGAGSVGPYTPHIDTVRTNVLLCGRTEWRRQYGPCDTCMVWGPPCPWDSYFVAGCGGPYYLSPMSYVGDIFRNHELIYYRKGTEECGTDIPMGMTVRPVVERLLVFPDPVDDVLRWTGIRGAVRLRIFNAKGSLVLDLSASAHVELGSLGAGAYILAITDGQGVVHRARFVKR